MFKIKSKKRGKFQQNKEPGYFDNEKPLNR